MLNPISLAFKKAKQENRAALLTYTVAGDSSKKQSLDILNSISKIRRKSQQYQNQILPYQDPSFQRKEYQAYHFLP